MEKQELSSPVCYANSKEIRKEFLDEEGIDDTGNEPNDSKEN